VSAFKTAIQDTDKERNMRSSQTYDFGPLSSHYVQAGDRLSVSHGVAWLTIHGEDVVLRAGASYLAEEAGHLLIEPMPACRYQLHAQSPAAPLFSGLQAAWAWLQGRRAVAEVCPHAR